MIYNWFIMPSTMDQLLSMGFNEARISPNTLLYMPGINHTTTTSGGILYQQAIDFFESEYGIILVALPTYYYGRRRWQGVMYREGIETILTENITGDYRYTNTKYLMYNILFTEAIKFLDEIKKRNI